VTTTQELLGQMSYSDQAAGNLLNHKLPDYRDEDWKYTHYSGFEHYKKLQTSGNPIAHPPLARRSTTPFHEDAWIAVVVNGILQANLSNLPNHSTGIRVAKLSEAISDDSGLEPGYSPGALALAKGHYYSQWAMAQGAEGLFIRVNSGIVAEKHLLIHTINDIQQPQQVLPTHHLIVLESNAALTLSETQEGSGEGMSLSLQEIHLSNQARLEHSQLQLWGNEFECIQQVLVAQQTESHYAHFAYCGGGAKVRNQLTVMQEGQLALTELTGLVLPGVGKHVDNQTLIHHQSPHTSSRQRYRSLVAREGTSVFNGKVYVNPGAQKTDAYQHHASLLMHETAVSNAKPELEIYADDVKCSHGATAGMLDAGEIHYMRSRGLSEVQARMMLQEAFVRDLLDSLPGESLRLWCHNHCSDRLNVLNQLSI